MLCKVGNAVPPPLARAIGLEVKKSVVWKMDQVSADHMDVATTTAQDF